MPKVEALAIHANHMVDAKYLYVVWGCVEGINLPKSKPYCMHESPDMLTNFEYSVQLLQHASHNTLFQLMWTTLKQECQYFLNWCGK